MGDGHGVDLNRNYGYKFAYNNIGSSGSEKICQEDYRGEGPFSEPETQAIKQFMTETHNIKAAINFHAYGPLWITPYNYYNDKNNSDIVVNSTTYNIYQYYKDNANFPQHNTFAYGNAKQTIDYQANGDASDWMLHDLGVIAVSIELGSDGQHKEKSYQFYPDQKSILPTLQECLPPVDFLVQMVKPKLTLTTYEQYFLPEDAKQTLIRKFFGKKENSDDYQVIIFTFFNQGLSGLRPNPQTRSSFFLINLKLQGHTSENVQKLFTRLFFEIQYEENVQQELKIDNYTYDYVMHLKQLNKVKKIQFYDMPDGSIDVQIQIRNEIPARSYIQFYLVLKNDSDLISHYNNIFDGEDLLFSTKFFIQSEFYKDYYFIGEQKYYINPNDYYFKEQADEGQSFDVKIIEPKFNLIRVSLENIDFFFVFGILVFIICLIYGVQKYRNSYTVLQLHNIINQDGGTEFVQSDFNQDIEISQIDDQQNDSN
ncbi:hypothetical protein PPERSA_11979 [Pseudocohnilembus persalinus]|uniref:Peptidase M14 domain-containing protein n=1 Tax=Pseudocohnilembus persalinus TaxID=266149 RepID=A0A0V0QK12_PSEPJ|nr:hypothetical protein PPERSA_11979 [Pseudocohnilembus persalinus]|eukprot:KRX02639.1 hypothetical protein PPERSA_11979 [Pseudocohnilembus persalinus]